MFDLSPEKLIALLAVGLVVLGPQRLPAAARSLAASLTRMKKLAHSLTEPIQSSLAEPRQAVQGLVSEARSSLALHAPERNVPAAGSGGLSDATPPLEAELN